MGRLDPKVLAEVAGCVAQIHTTVQQHPSLKPLVMEMLEWDDGARFARAPVQRTVTARPRRKMTAAQLKANSIRMKKRWREAKKAGRMKL